MAITRFAKPAELAPIDFDFLMKNKMYQDQKQDAASKTVDELTGVLASLNPAPGNIEWGTDISKKYNEAMGSIASDVGKVPIEQTMSDARKLRSNFINNPEVKTILNNKDYYDKVLAPYLANKENKFNVNMMPYLDQNTGEFKPNKLSYAGSLSYVPYQNVTDWADKQFKEAELRLSEDLRSKGMEIFTEPTTGLKYYTAGGERKYVRNEESFKPIIESTVDILMSGQNPESRFLKADAEWKQPGSFNRDYVRNIISPLTTKYYTEKIEGQPTIGWVPGQASENSNSPITSSSQSNTPSYITGETQVAIMPDDEIAKSRQLAVASSYKSTDNKFATEHLEGLKNSLPSLSNEDITSLRITRTVDPKDNAVNYKIGVTEEEYVGKFPENQKSIARSNYKLLANSFNNQAIQEQHLANLHTQAVNEVKKDILGDPSNPIAAAMHNYVDAVENYAVTPLSSKNQIDKQIEYYKEEYLKGKATFSRTDANDYTHKWVDQDVYNQEAQKLEESLKSGIIPQDLKKQLYAEMAQRDNRYKPLLSFSYSNEDVIANKYTELYNSDQIKNYNVITFAPDNIPEAKQSDLYRYETTLRNGFKTDKDKGLGSNIMGATYYVIGSRGTEGIKAGEYNSQELFGPTGTVAKALGVQTQGFIYDKENGWFLKGTLQGDEKVGGEEVLIKVPGMDERIISNLTANPDAAHFTSVVGTLLNAMPKTKAGIPELNSSKDPKLESIFSKFGMNDVYITGSENAGYHISFKPNKEVVDKLQPGVLDANGYLSKDVSNLMDLGSFTSQYTNLFGTGKK